MQMLDAQSEKSMEGARNPLHLYLIPCLRKPLSVGFSFIPERVILCGQDQGIRLVLQIFRQIGRKIRILPVCFTSGIQIQIIPHLSRSQQIIRAIFPDGREGGIV